MTDRPRRRHPAQGSRIAAAGFGTATMFGLVAAMGIARQASAESQPAPAPAAVPSQVVVGLRAPTAVVSAGSGLVAPNAGPVVLSAKPTVRPAPAGSASGTSSGSR